MFDNSCEFKQDYTPLLNYFDIKYVLTTIKNRQANASVQWLHQVILNILVTKEINNKVFEYIYTWVETLSSISWFVKASYHRTIQAMPGQDFFGRDMIFNLASVIEWRVMTALKQRQVDMDNVLENDRQVTHDYAIGNQVHVEITCIYRKLYYS